jgi:hypothetical protein
MGIQSFIVVVLFNFGWAMWLGRERYVSLYNGSLSKTLTALIWIYAAMGIASLVVACI